MRYLFPWMLSPFDTAIDQLDWDRYLNQMAWECVVALLLISTVLILLCYAGTVRKLKVRRPEDLLKPFRVMWWLIICVPAGIAAGVRAAVEFSNYFTNSENGIEPSSISIGLIVMLLALAAGFGATLIPGITPPLFKGRQWPRWLVALVHGGRSN